MKTVVALALLCALLAGHGANAVDVGAAINDAANAVANAASSAASSIKDGAGNLVCKSYNVTGSVNLFASCGNWTTGEPCPNGCASEIKSYGDSCSKTYASKLPEADRAIFVATAEACGVQLASGAAAVGLLSAVLALVASSALILA